MEGLMKLRIAFLAILCLALAVLSAWGRNDADCKTPDCGGDPAFYDNGPINGTTDAWTINFGYVVSDTFFTNNYNVVTGFNFGIWEFPGDSLLSVDYSITDSENAPCPSQLCLGNGTVGGKNLIDTFISNNQFGYNVDLASALIPGVQVPEFVTLWLNLQNAVVASGDPVFWDENSGLGCMGPGCPSLASESAVGTIPSEAFTMYGNPTTLAGCPEPSSILLFGSGILALAGVLRCKLHL